MNLVDVLNTIRDNASDIYRDRIPEATQNNIADIQAVMTDPNNAVVVNEWIGTMLNMLIKQVIHTTLFTNPLKALKKGRKPLGDTIEEIYANFVQAKGYDPRGEDLYTREMPDVKTAYHRMNRQDKYKVTIYPERIRKAFASYENLEIFINQLIATLVKSSELDEFVCTKQLIAQAIENNALKVVNIADPLLSEANAKAFIKAVKIISGDMTYPNSNNNAWLTAQSTDTKPLITNTPKAEQVIILDNATDVTVSIDVLASLFNMTVAEFNDTRKIVIDAFPIPSMRALVCDEQFFQIFDDLEMFRKAENADGLYDNYFFHVWQTLAYSPLVNAVALCVASDEDSDGEVEQFDVTLTLKTGVTSENKNTKVTEGSSYSTKLRGVNNTTDKVIVTMGGSDVTSSVYNASNNTININTITGALVITCRNKETYTITNTLASGVSNSNTATSITEDASYSGTLSGITTETVAVTMGGTTITSSAYNSSTKKINIAKVTGNIVITVS